MQAPRRILAAASTVAAILVLAAPAGAATISTEACVPVTGAMDDSAIPLTGAGFTPGGRVWVRYSSAASRTPALLTAVTADTAGEFSVAVDPPPFRSETTQLQTFRLTVTDDANKTISATTNFKQIRVGYLSTPETGPPGRIATHTVRGLPVGKNVYLHFRFGGKTRRNVKIGRSKGPCGIASRRLPLLPTRARAGIWTVYVDQNPVYSRTTRPQLKYTFPIKIRPR